MAKKSAATEQLLDELYREHPAGFVAGRDRLAKELREAGERERAEHVKKLRRPTVAAWLLNQAALTSPKQVERFVEATRTLEDAQRRALEGGEDEAAEWRAAAEREQQAIGGVLDAAERSARDAGHDPSSAALESANETLRAAIADPGLRERVAWGRLEREESGATLGMSASGLPPRRERRSEKRREVAQARRELERLEGELADATERQDRLRGRVERAEQALRDEKERLADGRRDAADLKRRVTAAKRRAR